MTERRRQDKGEEKDSEKIGNLKQDKEEEV